MKFLILLLFFTLHCATMTSRSQVISIDSEPRGMNVFLLEDKHEETLGTTPTLLKFPRQPKIHLMLRGKSKTQMDIQCNFRWATTLGGNLIFFYFWPLAVGIDYFSGNAYDCPLQNKLETLKSPAQTGVAALEPSKNKSTCKNYLLVYPTGTSREEIKAIWFQWRKLNVSGCNSLVPTQNTIESVENFGISSDVEFAELENKINIYQASFENKVTDLVYIRTSGITTNKPGIYFTTVDLHTAAESEEKELKIDSSVDKEILESTATDDVKKFAVKAMPNSLSIAPLYSSLVDIKAADNIVSKDRLNSNSASLISNWNFRNIVHPTQFSEWDHLLLYSPSFSFFRVKQTNSYNYAQNPEPTPIEYSFEKYSGVITYDIESYIHTPIGTYGTALGMGPAYEYFKDDEIKKHHFSLFFKIDITYSIFFTNNYFSRFLVSVNYPMNKKIETKIGPIESTTIVGLEFGYYFPWLNRSFF